MVVETVRSLLYTYNCVVIPNFGGIIAHVASSQIHPIKNTFSPPSKRLAFNENLKENDGLLISAIAKSEQISISESESLVARFIQKVRATIETEGMCEFTQIGVFTYNTEKKLQFKSSITENYLDDSFGLPELYFKPVERKEINTTMEQTPVSHPNPTPRGPIKKEELESVESQKQNKSLYLIIPIVLLVATVASLFLVKDHNGDMLMASVFPSLKSNIIIDSTAQASTESAPSEEEISSDDSWSTETSDWAAENASASSSQGTFHVIAGVFSKKSYAKRLAEKYNGEILEMGGYFKVSVGRFSTKEAATQQKNSLVGELGNDIWVLAQ